MTEQRIAQQARVEPATSIERVVIIGAGAVGAGTAAELVLAQREVLLIGRGQQIATIAAEGLEYRTSEGSQRVQIPTCDSIEAAELRSTDVVIMATKLQHVETASRQLAYLALSDVPQRTASTLPILAIQNGLAAEDMLLRRFCQVYSGSVLIPASYTDIGTVVSGAAPKRAHLMLGRAGGELDARVEEIASWLRKIHWIVETTDDVLRWKTRKLLHNVKNATEVLHGSPEELTRLQDALVDEARKVFEAASLPVASAHERTSDLTDMTVHPESGYSSGKQSTWQSFQRGADSEIDYLNGEIVLLGRRHRVSTPVNTAVVQVLGAAAARGAAPGEVTAAEVFAVVEDNVSAS